MGEGRRLFVLHLNEAREEKLSLSGFDVLHIETYNVWGSLYGSLVLVNLSVVLLLLGKPVK